MIAAMIAIQLAQAQPAVVAPRPVLNAPATVVLPPRASRAQIQADAKALLARAEAVQKSYRPAQGQPTKAELDAAIERMKGDLDSMSAMGEMESLRLQMAMDRMSKMMSTLSNLLKKISDTSQGIVQNIK